MAEDPSHMITGHGLETSTMTSREKGGVSTDSSSRMRRSCCECARHKKKCDGLTPCSRCIGAGVQCIYIKRKSTHPQYQRKQQLRGLAGTQSTELQRHSLSGAFLARDTLPLKRCRLSASPATGLVGMQENAFLSDFFGCVGFLPLTTRSHVRGAMVTMMAHSAAQHQLRARYNSPDQGQFGAIFSEDGFTTGNQLSTGPSVCTFWCAVGVGALVKGRPAESVTIYSRLARGALDAYTGPVDAEVAKAWAILAYLYGYMGDTAKFDEYLELSDSFLIASIEQGSTDMLPAGFAEMVNHKQTVKVYAGNPDATDIDSLAARRQDPPKITPAASERDVFRYVVQSLAAFDQVAFEKACKNSAPCGQSSDDEPYLENRGDGSPHGNAPPVEEVAHAMVAGFKDDLVEFEHLQETVDGPNIRTGIGGLLINITLAFKKAANGEAGFALKKLGHCVEVFERYPGLCGCTMQWSHLAHRIQGALAAIDDSKARGLYNRLRDVYNPFRPPAYLPAPPLEEWRGISAFCDHFQCRVAEGVIASQGMSAFSTPPLCASNCTGSQTSCKQRDSQIFVEEHHDSMLSAGVIPEGATGAMMVAPCSNRDKPMASTSSWELHQYPARQTGPPAGPSFSTSQVNCEPARGGTSDSDVSSGAVEVCDGGVVSGGVAHVPDMPLRSPELREVDGAPEETGHDTVAAADWLDVTHAMLGAID
ncbi:unnamed protein product [Ectocarpus sp. 6 AP-2014]